MGISILKYGNLTNYNDFILVNYEIQNDNCNNTDVLYALNLAEQRVLDWIPSNLCICQGTIETEDEIIENAIYMLTYDYLSINHRTDVSGNDDYELNAYMYLKRNGLIWV